MCLYFYYILLILIDKFSRNKYINVSFYEIKYLDLHSFLDFSSFFLVTINDFILFI